MNSEKTDKEIIIDDLKSIRFNPSYKGGNEFLLRYFILNSVNEMMAQFKKVQDGYFGKWNLRIRISLSPDDLFGKVDADASTRDQISAGE